MGGSFYVPFGHVKRWPWEIYWLMMGVVAWVFMPVLAAWPTVPDLPAILLHSPVRSLVLAYAFGAMWGVGAVTFGLSMRYLGISLGMAVVVGLCAAFGTLVPPLVNGQFGQLAATHAGQTVLSGVAICLVGIAVCGRAGIRKERELTAEQKQKSVKEFALVKGFVVATVSGVMSAGMVYGIHAGKPIARLAVDLGTAHVYQNNPVFVVVMAGGFTVNSIFCLILSLRNRSIRQRAAGHGVPFPGQLRLGDARGHPLVWPILLLRHGYGKNGRIRLCRLVDPDGLGHRIQHALGSWTEGMERRCARTLSLVWCGIALLILSATVIGAGSHLAANSR